MPKTRSRAPKVVDTETPIPKRQRRYRRFGLPVRDAKAPLAMPLLQVDIDKAEKVRTEDVNDPENFLSCVIAQAATRAWGAKRVAIYRTCAYVAFPGEDHAKRYGIELASKKVLAAWDRGEHIVEGVELRLSPPSRARSLSAMRKKRARWGQEHPDIHRAHGARKTKRKQTAADPLQGVVRNGNLVRWS